MTQLLLTIPINILPLQWYHILQLPPRLDHIGPRIATGRKPRQEPEDRTGLLSATLKKQLRHQDDILGKYSETVSPCSKVIPSNVTVALILWIISLSFVL